MAIYRMTNFKQFLESEIDKDLKETLAKVPLKHKNLIKGYKFKWETGCTLKGDDEHIGVINPKTKTITIASPFFYPRQFVLLHELAHKVWETFVLPNKRLFQKWQEIVKQTRNQVKKEDPGVAKQNVEELFCHAYGSFYCKTKITKFDHPQWDKFIHSVEKTSTS